MENKDQKDVRELQSTIQQETLEEAAERLIFKTIGNKYGLSSIDEHDQVDGYFDTYLEAFSTLKLKWHSQPDTDYTSRELLEQFKNK
jgi:hypothetical protein